MNRQEARIKANVDVARKLFWGGCCLLPWLWAVNLIYFRAALMNKRAPAELRKCNSNPTLRSPLVVVCMTNMLFLLALCVCVYCRVVEVVDRLYHCDSGVLHLEHCISIELANMGRWQGLVSGASLW